MEGYVVVLKFSSQQTQIIAKKTVVTVEPGTGSKFVWFAFED